MSYHLLSRCLDVVRLGARQYLVGMDVAVRGGNSKI